MKMDFNINAASANPLITVHVIARKNIGKKVIRLTVYEYSMSVGVMPYLKMYLLDNHQFVVLGLILSKLIMKTRFKNCIKKMRYPRNFRQNYITNNREEFSNAVHMDFPGSVNGRKSTSIIFNGCDQETSLQFFNSIVFL